MIPISLGKAFGEAFENEKILGILISNYGGVPTLSPIPAIISLNRHLSSTEYCEILRMA